MAMTNYYECHVKYEKTLETGTQAKADEAYLVDAMSFTEAEARIIEEMAPFIVGGFEVSAVKRAKISELFYEPKGDGESYDGKWHRCKVMFITLDEKTGQEKKAASTMYVQASDFQTAVKNLVNGMKGTMADWEIHTISETKIIDVFGAPSEKTESKEE